MEKINQKKLKKLLQKNNVLFVDMRSPIDFRDGHIEGSVNLPLRNFTNKLMGLPRNHIVIAYSTNFKDTDLVQGMNYAIQLGFEKLYIGEFGTLNS